MRTRLPAPVAIYVMLVLACAGLLGCSRQPSRADRDPSAAAAAWREIGYLDYGRARPVFERLRLEAAPGAPAWFEATLGLACCLHQGQPDVKADKQRAGLLYEEIYNHAARHACQPFAMLQRARLAEHVDYGGDEPDRVLAETLYTRLTRQQPPDRWAHEAALCLAQLRAFSPDLDAAKLANLELRAWLRAHPDNPMAALQWSLVAQVCMTRLEAPAEAIAAFRAAEAAGLPAMTQWDAFYWRLATLAQGVDDRETALTYFRRIILEKPRSSYGYEAQLRIKALGETPPALTDPFAEGES